MNATLAANRATDRQRKRPTDRESDRPTDRGTDSQTDRQRKRARTRPSDGNEQRPPLTKECTLHTNATAREKKTLFFPSKVKRGMCVSSLCVPVSVVSRLFGCLASLLLCLPVPLSVCSYFGRGVRSCVSSHVWLSGCRSVEQTVAPSGWLRSWPGFTKNSPFFYACCISYCVLSCQILESKRRRSVTRTDSFNQVVGWPAGRLAR